MTTTAQEPSQRLRWLDKWLGAGSVRTSRFVEEAVALVAQYEHQTQARKRQRKAVDEVNHRVMVEAVVMNLARHSLMPSSGNLAVLTGKARKPRTRYDHPAFGDTFASIISSLHGIGWLTFHPSPGMGEASAIAPSSWFRAKVHETGITLSEFRRSVGETIILSQKERLGTFEDGFSRELLDYPDTGTTLAMRSQMEGLNAFLTGADLGFRDDGLEFVDTFHRQQRRCFTTKEDHPISHDRGGRMFGGWWSNLNKRRRGSIRIENEPVAILDFSSMFVRLAYAHRGLAPPEGDLYAIPGLIGHRRAAKLIVNCLMFDEHHRRRTWPKVTASDEVMPEGMTMPRVREAILNHHPALAPCFGEGLGHHLMFTESNILMEVLLELKTRGVVGLGLHDGLMVPWSRASEVKVLMEEVSRQITSHTIPVTCDPAISSPSVSLSAPPYTRVISSLAPSLAA